METLHTHTFVHVAGGIVSHEAARSPHTLYCSSLSRPWVFAFLSFSSFCVSHISPGRKEKNQRYLRGLHTLYGSSLLSRAGHLLRLFLLLPSSSIFFLFSCFFSSSSLLLFLLAWDLPPGLALQDGVLFLRFSPRFCR